MAASSEVINTTFEEFRGPLKLPFARTNAMWSNVVEKGKVTVEGGHLIERTIAGGASAYGVGVYAGDEPYNGTRRQRLRQYQVEPFRMVILITIPKKDLKVNMGKRAVIRLIEAYPLMAMTAAKRDINSYLLTGVSQGLVFPTAELRGLLTFNGQISAGIGTGVVNGLFDFATPATQTDPVQAVAKGTGIWHFNQYQDIGLWSGTGLRREYQVYMSCGHHALGEGTKGPDVIIMDEGTYLNYLESRVALVRLSVLEGKIENSNLLSVDFGLAKIYSDPDLDLANFTGVANDGVTYQINTDHLEVIFLQEPEMGKFEDSQTQDVVLARWEAMFNPILSNFPAHGCVSGGAT